MFKSNNIWIFWLWEQYYCKHKESQAFWIRTLKSVSDDLYFNDLKLSSILVIAKLFYRIAPASFDLCLCSCPFQLL